VEDGASQPEEKGVVIVVPMHVLKSIPARTVAFLLGYTAQDDSVGTVHITVMAVWSTICNTLLNNRIAVLLRMYAPPIGNTRLGFVSGMRAIGVVNCLHETAPSIQMFKNGCRGSNVSSIMFTPSYASVPIGDAMDWSFTHVAEHPSHTIAVHGIISHLVRQTRVRAICPRPCPPQRGASDGRDAEGGAEDICPAVPNPICCTSVFIRTITAGTNCTHPLVDHAGQTFPDVFVWPTASSSTGTYITRTCSANELLAVCGGFVWTEADSPTNLVPLEILRLGNTCMIDHWGDIHAMQLHRLVDLRKAKHMYAEYTAKLCFMRNIVGFRTLEEFTHTIFKSPASTAADLTPEAIAQIYAIAKSRIGIVSITRLEEGDELVLGPHHAPTIYAVPDAHGRLAWTCAAQPGTEVMKIPAIYNHPQKRLQALNIITTAIPGRASCEYVKGAIFVTSACGTPPVAGEPVVCYNSDFVR
jgi:hypothetical protein